MEDKVCPFCNLSVNPDKWQGEYIAYLCGTLVNDQEPRTHSCWLGYKGKTSAQLAALQERLAEAERLLDEITGTPYYKSGWVYLTLKIRNFLKNTHKPTEPKP